MPAKVSCKACNFIKKETLTQVFFLKIPQNSQENACARVPCNFIKKETLAQAFSSEFCEIFKSTVFNRTTPLAVSEKMILHS